ncbi:hypothetical protein BB560_005037, partial [Smittium megazygosporum]
KTSSHKLPRETQKIKAGKHPGSGSVEKPSPNLTYASISNRFQDPEILKTRKHSSLNHVVHIHRFLIKVILHVPGKNSCEISAMIDSGASGMFIIKKTAKMYAIPLEPKHEPFQVEFIDGTPLTEGLITHHTKPLKLQVMDTHWETASFDLLNCSHADITSPNLQSELSITKKARWIPVPQKNNYSQDNHQHDNHSKDNYSQDNHQKDNHSHKNQDQDGHSPYNHSQDKHYRDNHSQCNHIQDKHYQDNHSQDKHQKDNNTHKNQDQDSHSSYNHYKHYQDNYSQGKHQKDNNTHDNHQQDNYSHGNQDQDSDSPDNPNQDNHSLIDNSQGGYSHKLTKNGQTNITKEIPS